MAITTLAMVATVVVGNLYDIKDRPVPPWAKRIFIVHVARLLCMCNCFAPPLSSPNHTLDVATPLPPDPKIDEKSEKYRLVTFMNPSAKFRARDARPSPYDGRNRGAAAPRSHSCRERRPPRGDYELQDGLGAVFFNSGSKEYYVRKSLLTSSVLNPFTASYQQGATPEVIVGDANGAGRDRGGVAVTPPVKNSYARDWAHVAAVCDRFFFWMCLIFIVATTLLLFHPLTKYSQDALVVGKVR
jgi:hypothetical protein